MSFFSLENYRSKVLSLVLLSYDVTDSLQTKIKRWTLLVIAVFSQTNSSNISAQLQAGKYVEEKSNFNVVYKEKETQFSCKKKKTLLLHHTRLVSYSRFVEYKLIKSEV